MHTKGPWCVDDDHIWDLAGDDQPGIPLFRPDYGSDRLWGRRIARDEITANAVLASQAPTMLADLIEAERMFRWYDDLHAAKPDPDKAARNYEMADRLAATIARATGAGA